MTLKSRRDLIVSNRRKTVYLKRETPATPPEELIVYLLSINGPNQRWFKIGPKKGPKTGKKKWSKNGPKMVQKWSKK